MNSLAVASHPAATIRSAIVTGGAGGLGRAIAARLVRSGMRVALWDRDEAALTRAAEFLDGAVDRRVVDVASEASVQAAAAAHVEAFGRIDVLINNAGIAGAIAEADQYEYREWKRVITVDLDSVFLCTKAVVPSMKAAGYGRIVNIASIAGKEGNPGSSAYSAAKAGVIAFTKAVGKELALTGILANAVAPAAFDTEILNQVSEEHRRLVSGKIPMGRLGRPDELAALVAWLASEEMTFSTGAVFDISGGRATY